MSASDTLDRLARNGYWLDPEQPDAAAWIQIQAARLNLPFVAAAEALARPAGTAWAAIRRQWDFNILWYQRPLDHILECCQDAYPTSSLGDALDLHEPDSRAPIPIDAGQPLPNREGVIFSGDLPVGVNVPAEPSTPAVDEVGAADPAPAPAGQRTGRTVRWMNWLSHESRTRGVAGSEADAPEVDQVVHTWPRVEAPAYQAAQVPFEVEVGFVDERQQSTTGEATVLPAPPGADELALTVELTAEGVAAPDGWTRPLKVPLKEPSSASVTFSLVGLAPPDDQPVLTLLEVRYLLSDGQVCGTASRPMAIGHEGVTEPPIPGDLGAAWMEQVPTASPVSVAPGIPSVDLTIELLKPDGNPTIGSYVCRIRSPHTLQAPTGPFRVELGHDAKTFAREIVDQVRLYGTGALADNLFRSFGRIAADKLPLYAALKEVADEVEPRVPSVLLVSAEPYVPWELTMVDPPLDPERPPYLGAQVNLGRWIRKRDDGTVGPLSADVGVKTVRKPPANPPDSIPVRHMAVMAGMYRTTSGFRTLPEAEAEAKTLTATYGAIPLAASAQALSQLLDARLEHDFQIVGGADAVHFAGHGEFDPEQPDSSVLFLSNGSALSSLFFAGANYGDAQKPLIFLNACMVGVGGEILGDMGGFPGNCLRGGFGGVLGALWEVDDAVARDVATEFWERVLPADGDPGEPVAGVLRDIRARYIGQAGPRVPSYLAYVYYGHPGLTLTRIVEDA